MKIFQLIDMIIRLFRLNKKSKVVLLFLIPTFLVGQNNAAFWLGKRASGVSTVTVDFLVVAGGGGGGVYVTGGGGGAGGLRSSVVNTGGGGSLENFLIVNTLTNYAVTVGSGGSGTTYGNSPTNGNNSTFYTITSLGGGAGGGINPLGVSGGSGGGGSGYGLAGPGIYAGGPGTANQGYAGGTGRYFFSGTLLNDHGGGGGGAGAVGNNYNSTPKANGGIGVQNSITGTAIYYSGGGGGAGYNSVGGSGGLGGGGNGGNRYNDGQNGTANTGGGGGAGGGLDGGETSGNGGSGVVIIRIPSSAANVLIGSGLQYKDSAGVTQNGNGTRVAPSYTPSGYKVYEFVGGTGNIQF